MRTSARRRDDCRLCGSKEVELVLPLGRTALAEAYVPAERLKESQPDFPLELFLCRACGHAQLLDVVDPEVLFRRYAYVSSSSPGLADHFREYARSVCERLRPQPGALAVDIGSNDGILLGFLKERGLRVLGVDPAQDIARKAAESGIPTIDEFFTLDTARRLKADHGPAALVTANNVFAHSDDLGGMADGVRELLAPGGSFVFEVSYLADTVQGMVFDFIYHEHLGYHSVKPLKSFLRRHGLELYDVERITSKGGSLRSFARRADAQGPVSPAVAELEALESRLGLDSPAAFRDLAAKVDKAKEDVRARLGRLKKEGRSMAGYGASATVTTLLHHFDLAGFLDFIVDDNPMRHGTYSPGHHVPVLAPEEIYRRRPAAVVVLAWRFWEPIVARHKRYVDGGGRFIIPLPTLREVP